MFSQKQHNNLSTYDIPGVLLGEHEMQEYLRFIDKVSEKTENMLNSQIKVPA